MATFNQDILQKYYDSRNYQGAADYLKSVPAINPQAQRQVNEQIRRLERDAAVQKSIIEGAGVEELQAYNFMQAIDGNGVIPRNREIIYNQGTNKEYRENEYNDYGQQYTDYINSLTSSNGNKINRLQIRINNDDDLKALGEALGYTDIRANDIGLNIGSTKNGEYTLTIDTNNKNLYKVYNAAYNLTAKSTLDVLGHTATNTASGAAIGAGIGSFFAGVGAIPGALVGGALGAIKGAVENIYDEINNNNRVKFLAIDDEGNGYDTDNFNFANLEKAVKTVNDANELYNNLMNRKSQEQTFTSETVVTQFLGANHAEAYKLLQQGRIDQDAFNKIEKSWEDYYDRLIEQTDFTQKPVYAWSADSGEGMVLKAVDNTAIPDLKGEIMLAMHENRCSKSLAIRDGVIGTMISITPKNDGKQDWSKGKGEVYKQVFVEGLFDESANAVFERDTQTLAAKQNADMKRYNYEQTLSNGETVGYKSGIGAYVKRVDNNGVMRLVPISESDMLRTLNESAIIDNSVSEVLANMDSNGELYEQTINGKKVKLTVNDALKTLSIAGTNEIYPKGSTTDVARAYYQNQLYLKMLEQLNLYTKNYNNN